MLHAIITSAVDGATLTDTDGTVRTLGYVWLAVLSAWVGGSLDEHEMADDLETAARCCSLTSPADRAQSSGSAANSRFVLRYQPMPAIGRFHRPFICLERRRVGVVAARDHLLQMAVLGLDDLVGGRPLQPVVTRSAQLRTRHGLHRRIPPVPVVVLLN